MRLLKLLLIIPLLLLAGCDKDEPQNSENDRQKDKNVIRTVLVYAVNRSSLSYDFDEDCAEMLLAMEKIDAGKFRLLVYYTVSETECGLFEARKSKEGQFMFKKRKSYARDVTSTHPDRIKMVMDDALGLYPDAAHDLIFWGHGTSWRPDFSDHVIVPKVSPKGYGGEYNPDGTNLEWTAVDELADALPDHKFQTIWFDCCYMTGIEVVYEMRDKCSLFVGYPTEVWENGLQYDLVLPYLFRDKPDVIGAAQAFYGSYAEKQSPVTVAVIDMSKLEMLADVAKAALRSGDKRPETSLLLNYSRMRNWPFYDFRQFFRLTAEYNGDFAVSEAVGKAVAETVVFSAAFGKDFNEREWNTAEISGLSTHYYRGTYTDAEVFYRSLDWYKRVYAGD